MVVARPVREDRQAAAAPAGRTEHGQQREQLEDHFATRAYTATWAARIRSYSGPVIRPAVTTGDA